MNRRLSAILLATLFAAALVSSAQAIGPGSHPLWRARANNVPWHGGYYDPAWGQPHALVIPPTAELQTKYSWGVTNTEVVPNYHQFRRNYPGPSAVGRIGFGPTPEWPWHTDQFGVYYVRGPWN